MLKPEEAVVINQDGTATLNFEKADGTIDAQKFDSPAIALQNLHGRLLDNQKAYNEKNKTAEDFEEDAITWKGMYEEIASRFDNQGNYIGKGATGDDPEGKLKDNGASGEEDKPITKSEAKSILKDAIKEELKSFKSASDKEVRQQQYVSQLSQAQIQEPRLKEKETFTKVADYMKKGTVDIEGVMRERPALAQQLGNNVFRVALYLMEKDAQEEQAILKNLHGTAGGSRGGGGSSGTTLTAEQRRSLSPEQRAKYFDKSIDDQLQKDEEKASV